MTATLINSLVCDAQLLREYVPYLLCPSNKVRTTRLSDSAHHTASGNLSTGPLNKSQPSVSPLASPTVGLTGAQQPTLGIPGHPEGHFQESHRNKGIPTRLGEVHWVAACRVSPWPHALFKALDQKQVHIFWWVPVTKNGHVLLHASGNVKLCLLLFHFPGSSEYSKRT